MRPAPTRSTRPSPAAPATSCCRCSAVPTPWLSSSPWWPVVPRPSPCSKPAMRCKACRSGRVWTGWTKSMSASTICTANWACASCFSRWPTAWSIASRPWRSSRANASASAASPGWTKACCPGVWCWAST